MSFRWLKRFMPRSLYGRAALILLLPIVLLQLIVSLAFIQRHFEDVTRQMTRGVLTEINLILTRTAADPADGAALAADLGFALVTPAEDPPADARPIFYDLSGRIVVNELREGVPGLVAVRLDPTRRVSIWVETGQGIAQLDFARRRVSASNPHQLLVLMAVFGALLTFIAYLFLRNQLRPIKRLAHAAEEFGKGRVTAYRPGGAAEVRAAGAAFLEMRARIERQVQTRNLMLSGVSHDLRTPLTRMRLELALMDGPEAEGLKRDVDEMGRMIDAFLDFARGSEGDPAESVDVVAMIAQLAQDLARTGGEITLRPVEGAPAPVRLRPITVRRAVENLLVNARRHGTRVRIGLVFAERSLRITVEDDGPGIPAERREDALRPFVRLEAGRNQDRGAGVGLGLAIVADAARGHGGSLRLGQSEDLGGLRADLILAR